MEKVIQNTFENVSGQVDIQKTRNERLNMFFDQVTGEENLELRSENVKHFSLGGHRCQAVVFSEPVHYLDENSGKWEEIDNNLETHTNAYGRSVLRNRANRFHVEMPEVADGNIMVKISADGRELSWGFENTPIAVRANIRTGKELKRAALGKAFENASKKGMLKKNTNLPVAANTEKKLRVIDRIQKAADFVDLTDDDVLEIEKELRTPQEIRMDRTVYAAETRYNQLFPGVSVKYSLYGDKIKEDIILDNAEAMQYAVMRLDGAYDYILEEDKSVKAKDKKTGETVFVFNPPIVWDSAEQPQRIVADIELKVCEGYTRLRYILDDEYLEKAVFPVTIDPVATTTFKNTNIVDTYLRYPSTTENYGGGHSMTSGVLDDKKMVSLIKFTKLVKQRASDTIIRARMGLTVHASPDDNDYMGVYVCNKAWSETGVTWANFNPDNASNISKELISYITSTETGICYFDITNLYRSWYKLDETGKSKNFGVAVRPPAGLNDGLDHYVEWETVDKESDKGTYMIVDYVSHAGIESWWEYDTMSIGRAGQAYVDLFNGNMIFEHADVSSAGNRMPVSVTHYYNSCLSEANDDFCGLGWRMSANQSLYYKTISSTGYYVWTDGDGTEHYFPKTGTAPYKDMEGMELKLSLGTDDDGNIATIKDKSDNAMIFPRPTTTAKKYIKKVTDACGNTMTYHYSDVATGKLCCITDGVGRKTRFTYNNNGLLDCIATELLADHENTSDQVPAEDEEVFGETGYSVHFFYMNDNDAEKPALLTGIGYSDLKNDGVIEAKTVFEYEKDADGNILSNMLTVVRNHDGMKLKVDYEAAALYDTAAIDNFAAQARKVASVECSADGNAGAVVKGSKHVYEYMDMVTKVLNVDHPVNDTGKTITYQFNDSGNVVCMFDELGFAQFTKFSSSLKNTPSAASKLQKSIINLATNIDFRTYSDTTLNWSVVKGNDADVAQQDTSVRCLNMPSFKIAKTSDVETFARLNVPVFTAGKHVFSVYVKTDGFNDGGAFARVMSGEKLNVSRVISENTAVVSGGPAADGWERIFVVVDVEAADNITLDLVCTAPSGIVYFACPQLEIGEIANRVNLLVNADFARTVENTANSNAVRLFPQSWSKYAGIGTSTSNGVVTDRTVNVMPDYLSGNAVRMISYPKTANVAFGQSVNVRGVKGDVFVVGGWLNSKSVAAGDTRSAPCVCYRFVNGDTNGDWKYLEYNREWVGWQFGCWAITATGNYTKIEYTLNYARNAQTAMFTNMFMYREQFGQSFAYDDKKNLVSVTGLASTKSNMTYDDYDNLLTYVQPGADAADKYTMTYGDSATEKKKHLVRTTTTPTGMKTTNTYDEYGNPKAVVNQKTANEIFIKTKSEYTKDSENDVGGEGNYLKKTIDARGISVERTYNCDGLLESVTDPSGQKVSYEYDDSKRVTKVEAVVGEGDNAISYKNQYEYEKDRIKKVKHNTTGDNCDVEYTFDYDELGRKTTVKVGDQVLSENVYEEDRAGKLAEVKYGNDGLVKYHYDEFDRLRGISYDNDENERYTYEYNASGEAAVVYDHLLERRIESENDLAERPVQNTVTDKNGDILYRTTLGYDTQNRLTSFKETFDDKKHVTSYSYDKDNRITKIDYDATEEAPRNIGYEYDELGRLVKRTVTEGTNAYETAYSYVSGVDPDAGTEEATAGTATTPLVESITHGPDGNQLTLAYTYDDRGNIISETRNGVTVTYAYDALGQLIDVNDPNDNTAGENGTHWTYTYDRGGNILSKQAVALNSEGTPEGTPRIFNYEYDSVWKDKLVCYDGERIEYDEIGNPIAHYGKVVGNDDQGNPIYESIRLYTWAAGRQLKQVKISPVAGSVNYAVMTDGVEEDSQTVLKIQRSQNVLSVKLLRGERDITNEVAASAFAWSRNSGDPALAAEDAAWTASHAGTKSVELTSNEVRNNYQYTCSYSEVEGEYGTVSVDNDLVATHTPAVTDASDILDIVGGDLVVTQSPRSGAADYYLENGVLMANDGFTGSITAVADFNPEAQYKVINFYYDHNGLRTRKVVWDHGVTETYDYTLHGKLITHMTKRTEDEEGNVSSQELHFFYDSQSKPAFVEFEGERYRYVHSLQGDIIAIVDAAGNTVVEYKYDAWGKPTFNHFAADNIIGNINPFRYRGYIFDADSALYYLRSRYYRLDWQRFINFDSVLGKVGALCTHNAFAYCNNIPVPCTDPNGMSAAGAIAAGAAGGIWDGPLPIGDILGVLAYLLISALSSKSKTKAQSKTKSRRDDEETYIYRRASGTPKSLTPRPKDTNGLSFSTVQPTSGKYFRTTIEAVNSSGFLVAIADPLNPSHILINPVDIWTMESWIDSRENADVKPHPYTLLLMDLAK